MILPYFYIYIDWKLVFTFLYGSMCGILQLYRLQDAENICEVILHYSRSMGGGLTFGFPMFLYNNIYIFLYQIPLYSMVKGTIIY